MNNNQIKAEIVGHSLSPQGEELISVLATLPRIILAELNTHRMLSKNTASSRAITFGKMLKTVRENPFIPIAWQKEHSRMQGSEYFNSGESEILRNKWLKSRDRAVESALDLASGIFDVDEVFQYDEEGELIVLQKGVGVTKQLVNRLLEPFMWITALITGSRQGWDNFFNLRCPQYDFSQYGKDCIFKSKRDALKQDFDPYNGTELTEDISWYKINKGQAEIHTMDLAEKIWDAVGESNPKQLEAGEWHIPFEDRINEDDLSSVMWQKGLGEKCKYGNSYKEWYDHNRFKGAFTKAKVKVSVAMAARTSYTVVGDEKGVDYEKMISLHDRLLSQDPPHSSPLEHCARAMSDDEYSSFVKGRTDWYSKDYNPNVKKESAGWCNNFKGFIPYRYIIDNDYQEYR